MLAILFCIYTNAARAQLPCPTGASITANNFCIYIKWSFPISQGLLDSTDLVYVPGVNGNKTNHYRFQQVSDNSNLIDVFKDASGQGGGGSCNANTTNLTLNSLAGQIIKFLIGNDTVQCLISNPLGMKMVSFEAYRKSAGSVGIQWVTAEEQNIRYYSVQRSLNAIDWAELTQYNPQNDNSTTNTHTYDYLDRALPITQGKLYYRIVTYDYDGSQDDSKVVAVNLNSDGSTHTTVYPTLTSGPVTIQTSDPKTRVTVVNLIGQHIQVPIDDEGTIKMADMSSLAAGMYLMNITMPNGDREIVKLTKY